MKKLFLLVTVLFLAVHCNVFAQQSFLKGTEKVPSHPRILLLKGEEKQLKKNIKRYPMWKDVHQTLMKKANEVMMLPVNEYKKQGMRLEIAYANFRHIFLMAYAYRMTGDVKYAQRIEKEMLQIASFKDWNPSHFLDVSEMTAGMALGYDWTYSYLSPESREKIEKAIIEKGLKPSYDKKYNWFVNATNNWNQVCNAGMAYGSLAIWDKDPALAAQTINRSIEKIKLPMNQYAPDGAYPEGVGYWEFGTLWNAMFLSALDKVFKDDFGLCNLPGFLQTGEYMLHTMTPNMSIFSYSDGGQGTPTLSPTIFWFYNKTKDASLLYNQYRIYQKYGFNTSSRIAPAIMIWGSSYPFADLIKPKKLFWKGNGANPIACMRANWDDDQGAYLGVKLGSPSINHGHMDVGSFIFASEGVDWAIDLGGESYFSLESKGVRIWDTQRWDVFRYKNIAHNTLAFNEKPQVIEGKAEIDRFSDNPEHMYVVSDITPVYKKQVKSAVRALSLVDKKYAVIEDKILSQNCFTKVTWTLVTPAHATVAGDNKVLLEKDGKKLYMHVNASEKISFTIKPAKSTFSFDTPNPGVSLVTFDMDLKRNAENNIRVYLTHEENAPTSFKPVL